MIESGVDGITIRDSGSANGVFVNGKKAERARLREGDAAKLGDVTVTLLPDAAAGTVVMETFDGAGLRPSALDPEVTAPDVPDSEIPAPARRRPPSVDAFRPAAEVPAERTPLPIASAAPGARPLTISVLAALWALSLPLYLVAGGLLAGPMRGPARAAVLVGGIALAALSAAMAVGLWQGRRWAHMAQVGIAGLGLFLCPFSLASIAVLVYVLRPAVQWHFSDRRQREPEGVGQAEPMFAGALVAAVVLGVLLTAALTFLARTVRTAAGSRGAGMLARTPPAERAALGQLRTLASAQDAFHSVCNTGYADLEALLRPSSVIPDYPGSGPAFLRDATFDASERGGYRFALSVEDPMPPAPGCPTRRFRRYLYTAAPLESGRYLAVGPDGVAHAAEGRPATLEDPAAE